jgi:hypothetical protein
LRISASTIASQGKGSVLLQYPTGITKTAIWATDPQMCGRKMFDELVQWTVQDASQKS